MGKVRPAAKVAVWSGIAALVLFVAAWVPLQVVGASRHEQGAVFLTIYGVVAALSIAAAVRTGLRVRHQREQQTRDG